MRFKPRMIFGCGLLLIAGAVAAQADDLQVRFYDSDGSQLTYCRVGVRTGDGKVLNKVTPDADGVFTITATPGTKLAFELSDIVAGDWTLEAIAPQTGPLDVRVPEYLSEVVPPNDLCDDAIGPLAVPSLTPGTTIDATPDSDAAPFCGSSLTAPGVWYTTIGTGNTMTATTCENQPLPGSADYDTKISVYCQGCDPPVCVDGNDDESGCDFHSTVAWDSQAGAQYRILVHGFSSNVGNFELSVFEGGVADHEFVQCLPTGACCTCLNPPFNCSQETAEFCAALGGDYQGDRIDCIPVEGDPIEFVAFPGVEIPDNDPTGVSDTITVPDSLTIGDVNVDLGISHTFVGDLVITVEHNGTSQTLWSRSCGTTENINATADDEGTEVDCEIIGGGPIDEVFFSPTDSGDGPLSVFDGMDSAGDWTLTVSDNASLDTGTFDQWSLHITAQGRPICEQRKVTLCHVPPGNPGNKHTISVGRDAVDAHLAHGDWLGACESGGQAVIRP